MNKQEFINSLRLALSGKVSAGLVEENVAYYEEYINTQIRMGSNEASVLSSLGDPRLIAKSIITANHGEDGQGYASADTEEQQYHNNTNYYTEIRKSNYPKVVSAPGWVWLLVGFLIILLVISILFSVVSALLPIVLPILVVVFFIKLFRDWLN